MSRPATELRALQADMAKALLGESPKAALPWIADEDGLARHRLFVYRKNVQASLLECLQRRYARVRVALGGTHFDELALSFARQHPPVDVAMIHYGAGFAGFLARQPAREPPAPGRSIPLWLPELATLELYWHESFHAQDQMPLKASELSGLQPEELSQLRLTSHTSLRSLVSNFDLLAAWEAPSMPPPAKACLLLVVRPHTSPALYRLEGAFAQVFTCLASGGTSTEALELAPSASDFSYWLAKLLSWGVFATHHNRTEA